MPATTGRFGRSDRLRRSWEFQRVSRTGRREASQAFVMIAAPSVTEESAGRRLGVTVSRRVGGAVVRNLVKRRIRSWFRRSRGGLTARTDLVVIARRSASQLDDSQTDAALSELLRGVGGSER